MTYLMNTIEPLFEFASGRGAKIWTSDGRELIDLFADSGASSMGYRRFAGWDAPAHVPNLYRCEVRERAAATLCRRTEMEKAFFSNSGSEAIEAAIKIARLATGRTDIWSLRGAFHGRTFGALAASDGPPYHYQGMGPMPSGFRHFTSLEEIREDAAAILVEPVFGNKDVLPQGEIRLRQLRERATEIGALVVYDEAQTGAGRVGAYTANELYDGGADVICLAKGVAMGSPLGVTLARGGASAAFTPGVHFSTFGGTYRRSLILAVEMVEWLDKGGLEDVKKKGEWFRQELAKVEGVYNVRGVGLMIAFDVEVDRRALSKKFLEHGVILPSFAGGPGAMKVTPPLNVIEGDLDDAIDGIKIAMGEAR